LTSEKSIFAVLNDDDKIRQKLSRGLGIKNSRKLTEVSKLLADTGLGLPYSSALSTRRKLARARVVMVIRGSLKFFPVAEKQADSASAQQWIRTQLPSGALTRKLVLVACLDCNSVKYNNPCQETSST
jgi:hypothetical protein